MQQVLCIQTLVWTRGFPFIGCISCNLNLVCVSNSSSGHLGKSAAQLLTAIHFEAEGRRLRVSRSTVKRHGQPVTGGHSSQVSGSQFCTKSSCCCSSWISISLCVSCAMTKHSCRCGCLDTVSSHCCLLLIIIFRVNCLWYNSLCIL